MRTGGPWLAVTVVVLTAGCGGHHLQTREPMTVTDGAAPDGGAGTGDDAATNVVDALPPDSDALSAPYRPRLSTRPSRAAGPRMPAASCRPLSATALRCSLLTARWWCYARTASRGYTAEGSRRPATDGRAAALVTAPDGTALTGDLEGSTIVLKPVGQATARFQFPVPSGISCGRSWAFSLAGDYFLAHGGGASCLWRAVDGGFVVSFAANATAGGRSR